MEYHLKSIGIGKPKVYGKGANSFVSSYKKDQMFQYIDVYEYGLDGDTQSDKRYHGGLDKALHFGASKHFEKFETIHAKPMDKLSIGCNVLVNKVEENDICVGDIYSIGDILLEVTQPRQPCWKIGALFGKEMSRYIIKNSACGWYVRILREGTISLNDTMKLKKRVSNYTIKDLSLYLHKLPSKNVIDDIFAISALAQSYKDDLLDKINL